jgi:hypothetical protein
MKRPMSSYRSLTPEKIVETIAMIVRRIDERFPESGLGNVGRELHQISKEAVLRAEEIRRPQTSLRAVIGLLVTIIVALMATLIARLRISDEVFLFAGQPGAGWRGDLVSGHARVAAQARSGSQGDPRVEGLSAHRGHAPTDQGP